MASAEKIAEIKKNMKYVRLGKSGLKISQVVLGMMSYGSPEWQPWVLPAEQSLEHIKLAYDLGINAFDTANVYSNGESERITGQALKKYNIPREEVVIMTKLFAPVGREINWFGLAKSSEQKDAERYTNQYGLSRKHIFDSVQASLKRLDVEYIDLFQCHRFDPNTPIEETMQALHDVVQKGWVRYIGVSSCRTWQFHVMQNYAIANKLTPFISMQNHYNLVYREDEREMMPSLQHFGVGSIPWSPLARGLLTRPYEDLKASKRGETDWFVQNYTKSPATPLVNARVDELAKKKGVTMAQVALAWTLSKPAVSAPIIGSTNIEHLMDVVQGITVKLTPEEVSYLEEPYQTQGYIGHE